MPENNHPGQGRDAYYTPDNLAQEAVDTATTEPRIIMDPAVGDGSLLRAAASRWPGARVVGLDVDRHQLRRTRANHPAWSLGRVDMFSRQSRAASALWQSSIGAVDLMLLNPPFSYRGGRSKRVPFENADYALTPASAFVALSLSRLAPNGELVALVPAGVLALERDADFWAAVSDHWSVDTRGSFASTAFSGTRTKSILVSVGPKRPSSGEVVEFSLRPSRCIELVRGRVPVHALAEIPPGPHSASFLHTRDLAALAGRAATGVQTSVSLATSGPFLTLPRVGKVRPEHVKIVATPGEVVLSDCVFALRTGSRTDLVALQALVLSNLYELQLEYVGGCAPYLTIRRLVQFLTRRGYCCHHVPASSPPRIEVGATACVGGSVAGAIS